MKAGKDVSKKQPLRSTNRACGHSLTLRALKYPLTKPNAVGIPQPAWAAAFGLNQRLALQGFPLTASGISKQLEYTAIELPLGELYLIHTARETVASLPVSLMIVNFYQDREGWQYTTKAYFVNRPEAPASTPAHPAFEYDTILVSVV